MTPQQKGQLIKELEKLRNEAEENQNFVRKDRDKQFYLGRKTAYDNAISIIKQTTVNRSSTELKFIEG